MVHLHQDEIMFIVYTLPGQAMTDTVVLNWSIPQQEVLHGVIRSEI